MELDKQNARKSLLKSRLAISSDVRAKANDKIIKSLQNLNWDEVKSLHYFEPIAELGEVNILPFIEWMSQKYQDVGLFTFKKKDGQWFTINSLTSVKVKNKTYDHILVPLLGFDVRLHRIGYGGGHYDRFLSQQKKAKKIGVSYELSKKDLLPIDEYDVPLDYIVTEVKTYSRY